MSRIDFVTGAPERHMHLVEALGAIPDRLEAVLAGHSTGELQAAPSGDEWAAARILSHMISYARRNHEFIYRIVWMTDPVREPWDEDAEEQGWESLDGAALVAALRAAIGETVELLSETPDASWGRPGIAGGRGADHGGGTRRSLRRQVGDHTAHLEQHLDHIEELLTAKAPV